MPANLEPPPELEQEGNVGKDLFAGAAGGVAQVLIGVYCFDNEYIFVWSCKVLNGSPMTWLEQNDIPCCDFSASIIVV